MKSMPFKLLPVAAAVSAVVSGAIAAPPAPQVLQGTASVSTAGSVQTITHSANALLNFQSFNVLPGETVRFVQPNAASTVLNRVLGGGLNIGGTVDSNGRVLFQTNSFVTGSGFSLDLGATALSVLKLGAPLTPRTALAPVVRPGDEILASLAQGRVLVFAGKGTRSGISASSTGEVLVPAGGRIELADIAWPNIRVEITAPSDRALNVSRLLTQNSVTGVFGGLFAGPKLRVRTGSDEPVMVAYQALPGLTAGRYASPSLGTMRFIESALREIALGRALAPGSTSSEQPSTALAGVSLPVAHDGAQDQDAVALAALAAVREEIVVASIRSTDVVAVLDGSAGLSSLVPAEIGEMSVAAAEHAALVSAEISETRLAAAEPAAPVAIQVSEISIAAVVPAAPVPAEISEMRVAAIEQAQPVAVQISEMSVAAAEQASPVAAEISEMRVAAVERARPVAVQISEMSVAAAEQASFVSAAVSEASIAAGLPAVRAPTQVAAKPVMVVASAQSWSMPAPKVVNVAASAPASAPVPQRAAPQAAASSEPVSAVAEMVADLPLTKRDIWGDSDSTKLARAAQPKLPAFVMDNKGGIFYL